MFEHYNIDFMIIDPLFLASQEVATVERSISLSTVLHATGVLICEWI